jgi:hypothetical protein
MLELSSVAPVAPVIIISTVVAYIVHHALGGQKKRYPPGPPGVPILGNYFELSTGNWNDKFTKWRNVYGTLISS